MNALLELPSDRHRRAVVALDESGKVSFNLLQALAAKRQKSYSILSIW